MSVKKFFPELNYYFYNYISSNNNLYVKHVDIPDIDANINNVAEGSSIFQLLFDNDYPYSDYVYTFSTKSAKFFSPNIVSRIKSTYSTVNIYITDSTSGSDVLLIEDELKTLTDLLLTYRTTTTCDLSSVDYNSLTKNLSIMIYQYLNFKVNGVYTEIDTTEILSSTVTLDNLYEYYLLNELYGSLVSTGYLQEPSI